MARNPKLCGFAVLVGAVALSGCSSATAPQPDPLQAAGQAVLTITTAGVDGSPLAQGTGFLIEQSGVAVTNFHVLAGASTAMAKLADGRLFQVLWVGRFDAQSDLAVVQIGRSVEGKDSFPRNLPVIPLGGGAPLVGEDVSVIGSPEGMETSLSKGIVAALRGPHRFQFTAAVSHGSSGSPILGPSGRVIGIVVSAITTGENINFGVDTAALQTLRARAVTPVPLSALWRLGAARLIRAQPRAATEAGDSLSDDSDSAAVYSGDVANLTAGVSARAGLILFGAAEHLRGCFVVAPPLAGSGAVTGRVGAAGIQLQTAGGPLPIAFRGQIDSNVLSGNYAVAPAGAPAQTGHFEFSLSGWIPFPSNFRALDCPRDADMGG